MFIFSFLKFLYNLYSHFCTFAFRIPENYVPDSSIFSQNDSETNRTFRGPWNGNKLTCDGALQQLKRYDGFGAVTTRLSRKLSLILAKTAS